MFSEGNVVEQSMTIKTSMITNNKVAADSPERGVILHVYLATTRRWSLLFSMYFSTIYELTHARTHARTHAHIHQYDGGVIML